MARVAGASQLRKEERTIYLIYTGRKRVAELLHRRLKEAGIDAIVTTGAGHLESSVFIPTDDADSRAIPREIEQAEIEYDAEGGDA
ncbi:MAG: hypothetical protein ACREM1_11215 [Longimicrobiales bacterium]